MPELPQIFWFWAVSQSFALLGLVWAQLWRVPSPSLTTAVVVPAGSAVVLRSEHVLQPEAREALWRMAADWKAAHGVSVMLLEGPGWKADLIGAN